MLADRITSGSTDSAVTCQSTRGLEIFAIHSIICSSIGYTPLQACAAPNDWMGTKRPRRIAWIYSNTVVWGKRLTTWKEKIIAGSDIDSINAHVSKKIATSTVRQYSTLTHRSWYHSQDLKSSRVWCPFKVSNNPIVRTRQASEHQTKDNNSN
jgi:hypothetical protein